MERVRKYTDNEWMLRRCINIHSENNLILNAECSFIITILIYSIISDNRILSAYFTEIKDSLLDCFIYGCIHATNIQLKNVKVFRLV